MKNWKERYFLSIKESSAITYIFPLSVKESSVITYIFLLVQIKDQRIFKTSRQES